MPNIKELHRQAMDLAEDGFLAKKKGDETKSLSLFSQALELEEMAAESLELCEESEPTRSILYRSAASLAFNIGDFRLCDRLIARGLSGFPPEEIEEELKNLYEDVNFMRHLSVRGLELDPNQWLMSISGNAVKYGGAVADHLLVRVEKIKTLFYRTVERLLEQPYRNKGVINKEIKKGYELYINAFEPRSFGISFQIGKPDPQMEMFPELQDAKIVEPEGIIDEIFKCFELLEKNDLKELKEKIKDETYYENFIGLVKEIAPDGNNVKMVGFNTIRRGKENPIALKKSRKDLRDSIGFRKELKASSNADVYLTLTGSLMRANTPLSGKYGTVVLVEFNTLTKHTVKVPISIMKDVVQPYYEEVVTIYCTKRGERIFLEEIESVSE